MYFAAHYERGLDTSLCFKVFDLECFLLCFFLFKLTFNRHGLACFKDSSKDARLYNMLRIC